MEGDQNQCLINNENKINKYTEKRKKSPCILKCRNNNLLGFNLEKIVIY